jgi:hypothetical protein
MAFLKVSPPPFMGVETSFNRNSTSWQTSLPLWQNGGHGQ